MTIVAGDESTQTVVRFRNRQAEQGQLKICKVAGAGVEVGEVFTFRAGDHTYNIPAGPHDDLTDGFCVFDGRFAVGTDVTVTETEHHGAQVAHIDVLPSDRHLTHDGNAATVRIGTGVTEVILTDERRAS